MYMQRAKIIKHAEITIDNKALCTHCRPMVIEFIIVLCAKKCGQKGPCGVYIDKNIL